MRTDQSMAETRFVATGDQELHSRLLEFAIIGAEGLREQGRAEMRARYEAERRREQYLDEPSDKSKVVFAQDPGVGMSWLMRVVAHYTRQRHAFDIVTNARDGVAVMAFMGLSPDQVDRCHALFRALSQETKEQRRVLADAARQSSESL